MTNDVFTLDENNNAAIRTVGVNGVAETNSPSVFTEDENGNAAVRVVGSGGSIDENKVIVKSADIPEASADVAGQMYCYDGETNSTYVHGYIYECVEGSPTYADTVEFEPATLSGTVVTATSNSLANLCEEYITGDITSIVSGTMTYDQSGDLWVFVGKDAEDTTVGTFQLYTQDYEDAGFTFTGTPEDGDVVAFTCTITESATYSWERIDVQPVAKLGRYLSSWNCATGLAGTNPPESPYEYTTGDYFIVGTVATGGGTNYRPNGSSYVIGQASTTVESSVVTINDMYLYDGTNWTLLKTGSTVTSVNGQVGDVTVQETLVSGTNIKTIDGNSVLGSGDLELSTFLPFPAGWTTNSTTKALCDDIAADTSAVKAKAYLGEVTCSDLPASISNSEINVYINDGTTASDKVIILELTSGNVAPYRWVYVYWDNGSNVSGWKTWQEPLVSGTNIKTINGTSLLGSGDITTEAIQVSTMPTAGVDELGKVYQFIGTTDANYTHGYFYECVSDGQNPATYSWTAVAVQAGSGGLPSQTGNSGKFLTTDGTDASWSDKPLVNNTTASQSLNILGNTSFNPTNCVIIGYNSFSMNASSVAVGNGAQNTGGENVSIGHTAQAREARSIAIGYGVHAWSSRSIAIGGTVPANASGAMQFGGGQTNSDSGTVKFGLTADSGATYTNYTLLNNDGTIPTDRFTTTPVADGTYVPTVSISSGVATRSWTTPTSAPVVPATMPELTVVGWSSNTQTVNVTGVTANNIVFVSPAPASASDYASAGIVCTAQGAGTLTFTCTTVPSNAITVNVVILG